MTLADVACRHTNPLGGLRQLTCFIIQLEWNFAQDASILPDVFCVPMVRMSSPPPCRWQSLPFWLCPLFRPPPEEH